MDTKSIYTNRKNIVLLATLCCFLWGSAYPCIKIGYKLFNIPTDDITSKFVFAGVRFFLAGLIVLAISLVLKKNIFSFNKKEMLEITFLGLGQTSLQYIFFYVGMTFTTGITGSIITGSGTFFSIILAHFIYKNDKINRNKVVGCIVGFAGVVLANLNNGSLLKSSFSFKGEGLIMLAALSLSIFSIYGKKITQKLDAFIVTGYQLSIGGLALIILGYGLGGKLVGFNIKSTLLLIYMALLSSVAFSIWTILLKYNKVAFISMFNFLVPVFGAILSAIFLGENIFDVNLLLSLILVCIGIFTVYKQHN
ncbi:Exported membrane protein [Clostridium bornimense]|uniref:Exported membrane protein n=1 Tax=Clostridium bornimense TaxID=1216932 RepID=W6SK75_9CLOT|nr:DMT family transporter [Clostridium bornimense]CDM70215.1 Exported membrane protein [Clostridium bornimense]